MNAERDPSDVSKIVEMSDKPPEDWLNPPKEDVGGDVYGTFFSSLSDDEKVALVKLPYRVGLFVSESDSTGGDEAGEAEKLVLRSIIQSMAEDFCKCELVQRVMQQTMKYKAHWSRWEENLEEVPIECKTLVWLMSQHGIDADDSMSVRRTLLEIAVYVAKAFNEEDEEEAPKGFFANLFGSKKKLTIEGMENISEDETIALKVLEKYLSVDLRSVL